MDATHFIFLCRDVTHFSEKLTQHFARCVQCAPENPGLPPQAVPEALGGNPVCDTIPSCNPPRTTKDGVFACSSVLQIQECMHVQRWKRVSRIAPVSAPSVLRLSVPTTRSFAAVEDPNYPGPASESSCTHLKAFDRSLLHR